MATCVVAVVTCDRPALLAASLAMLAVDAPRSRADVEVILVDSSRDASSCAANQRAFLEAGFRGPRDRYVSTEELEVRSKHALLAEDVPEAAAALLSTPCDVGASRNVAMLLSAGRPLLMLDDDVLCEARAVQASSAPPSLEGKHDQRRWRFFAAREEAKRDLVSTGQCVSDAMLAPLGQSAWSLVGQRNGAVQPSSSSDIHDQGGIQVTVAGIVGDTGRYCATHLPIGPGPLREQLLTSPQQMEKALAYREVTRVAVGMLVTDAFSEVSGHCLGLNNTRPLPPFLPWGRGEDQLFGRMVCQLVPGAMMAHMPFAVVHESNRPAEYGSESLRAVSETRLSDLLCALLETVDRQPGAAPEAQRWIDMATWLRAVAAKPADDLLRYCVGALLRQRCRLLFALERDSVNECLPKQWREACQRYRRAFQDAANREAFFIPVECRGQAEQLRQALLTFSGLVAIWPRAWSVARAFGA